MSSHHLRYLLRGGILLLCLCLSGPLYADSWGPPTLEHWSANHKFVLVVNDRSGALTLLKVTGNTKMPVWKVPTPYEGNFNIPARALIRDDGRFVVLQDLHGRLGYGKVLVFLGEKGRVSRALTLEDLFSQSEIIDLPHTISSTWWSGSFQFIPQADCLGFIIGSDDIGVFDLTTGKRLPDDHPNTIAFRNERMVEMRRDLNGRKVGRGLALAGVFKDRESVPAIKRLLADPAYCRKVAGGKEDDYREMELTAGNTLVQILGKEAAPLIEAPLARANPKMTTQWIDLIQKTGAAAKSPTVHKLLSHPDSEIRDAAIWAVLENDGVDLARRHPEWMNHRNGNVRWRTIRCLVEFGDNRDLPLFRKMLNDPDKSISLWALRGLIRLKPSDLTTILKRRLPDPEARLALAELGDTEQLRWCVTQLSDFAPSVPIPFIEWNLQEAAMIVVRHRPPGTKAALEHIARQTQKDIYNETDYYQSVGYGGLAALGDRKALTRARGIAAKGDMFHAPQAIAWLVICQDRDSIPLLRTLLKHREEAVRDAARDALKALKAPEKEPVAKLSAMPAPSLPEPAPVSRKTANAPALPIVVAVFITLSGTVWWLFRQRTR